MSSEYEVGGIRVRVGGACSEMVPDDWRVTVRVRTPSGVKVPTRGFEYVTGSEKEWEGVGTCVSVGAPVSERVSRRELEAVTFNENDSVGVLGAVSVSGGVTVELILSVWVRVREGVSTIVFESVGTIEIEADADVLVVTVCEVVPVPETLRETEAVSSRVFESVTTCESDSLLEMVVVIVRDALALADADKVCVVVVVAEVDRDWVEDAEAECVNVAVKVWVAVGLGRGMTKKIVWQLPTGTRCTYSSIGTEYRLNTLTTAGLRRSSATVLALQRTGIAVTSDERARRPTQRGIVSPVLQSDTMVKSVPVTEAPELQPA